MPLEPNAFFQPQPLRRQLSATYTYQGQPTQDDPDSYQGAEREARMLAVIRDLPWTGYAQGYREELGIADNAPNANP